MCTGGLGAPREVRGMQSELLMGFPKPDLPSAAFPGLRFTETLHILINSPLFSQSVERILIV